MSFDKKRKRNDGDGGSIESWSRAIKRCFRDRITPDLVVSAFETQYRQERISGHDLTNLIFQSAARPTTAIDPLVPRYINQLLELLLINSKDVFQVTLETSRYANHSTSHNDSTANIVLPPIVQETILNLMSNLYSSGDRPKSFKETQLAFSALLEWLSACVAFESVLQISSEGLQAPDSSTISVFEHVGYLAVIFLCNDKVKKFLVTLSNAQKERCNDVLSQFSALLARWSQSQIQHRLETIARYPPLGTLSEDGTVQFTATDVSETVSALDATHSRVGLYIYLNAALCAKPLLDDSAILNYLHARYSSDPQQMISSLIVASFDVLANALRRHKSEGNTLCYKSFVANKLPLLILSLSSSLYPPMTAERCINMALARLTTYVFPPISSEGSGVNEILEESHHNFMQGCYLHQLVSEVAPSSKQHVPANQRRNRYTKDLLTSQCTNNIHRVDELVNELPRLQGNAGAISLALVETIHHFCSTKETMSLKTVCNAILRQLTVMDVILQYANLETILTPLCTILDDWTQDEDRSELTPAYEEFGSILLFILAVMHRYDVDPTQLETIVQDTFVPNVYRKMATSIPVHQLTSDQSKQLGKWVKGLYATDDKGDTNGISDETMAGCPPQAFYALAPTLFEQSVQALMAGSLDVKTLNGGLELFLEPFLLPSIVMGISWLANRAWRGAKDLGVLLQMLDKLLRPASISGDAQWMHKAILTILSKPLSSSLRQLEQRFPKRKESSSLVDLIQPYLNNQRCSLSKPEELHEWQSNGGFEQAIAGLVRELTTWSNESELNPIPTKYTHRMMIAAEDYLGVDKVLMAIVDEITMQTSIGLGSSALEVGTSLICAPCAEASNSAQSPSRLTLRRALKLRVEDVKVLLKTKQSTVETLVRLDRSVDAQSVISQIQMPMTALTNIGTDELMAGIDMSAADMVNANNALDQAGNLDGTTTADFAAVMDVDLSNTNVDLSGMGDANAINDLTANLFGGQDIDFSLDSTTQAPAQTQNAQQPQNQVNTVTTNNADDDIFADLDFGGMDNFEF